jgi:hypothetical protein
MAYKIEPPPRPPRVQDQVTAQHFERIWLWMDGIYRKLGAASDTAPISVEGTAATITGDLAPAQLSGPVPISLGGTGAVDAAAAAANLGVQSVISPGSAGKVPVSNGIDFVSRRLDQADIQGVPETQAKHGFALTAASGAAIGDHGDTVVTWDSAFSDANYTLQFTVTPTTGVPIATIVSKTASDCTVRITNATAVMCAGTGDVTATHF